MTRHRIEGGAHTFTVQPVIFHHSPVSGWSRRGLPEGGHPEAWTIYREPRSHGNLCVEILALEDHFTEAAALERAEKLAREDKTLALLRGE